MGGRNGSFSFPDLLRFSTRQKFVFQMEYVIILSKVCNLLATKKFLIIFFNRKEVMMEVTASRFAGKLSGPKNGGGKDRVGMRVPFYHKTSVEWSGGRVNKLFVRERGEKVHRKQGRWWMEERRYGLHH